MPAALLIYWRGVILLLLKVLLLSNLSFGCCPLPRLPLVGVDLVNQLLTPLKIRNDCFCQLVLAAGTSPYHDPPSSPPPLPFTRIPLSSQKSHCLVLVSLFCGQKHLPQSLMTHIWSLEPMRQKETPALRSCPLTSPHIHRMNKCDICVKKKNHCFMGKQGILYEKTLRDWIS